MRLSSLFLGLAALTVCSFAQADYRDGTVKILGQEGNSFRRANVVRTYAAPRQLVAAQPAAQPTQVAAAQNDGGRRVMSAEPTATVAPARVQAAAPVYRAAPHANGVHRNRDAWDNADTKILGLEGH